MAIKSYLSCFGLQESLEFQGFRIPSSKEIKQIGNGGFSHLQVREDHCKRALAVKR